MNHFTDQELVRHYLEGDEASLEVLVRRHMKGLYNFLARYTGSPHDADDLVQETFFRVWKHIRRFDLARDFRVWLFSIARNVGTDWLRKKRPTFSLDAEIGEDLSIAERISDTAPIAEELFDERLKKEELERALKSLSPIYQSVLLMRYNEDFTFQDIAEILGESVNTVKSRYRRAVANLKAELAKTNS